MIKILNIIQNQKEAEILELAFKQKFFRVITALPGHSVYIKCLQYDPDIVLAEMTLPLQDPLSMVILLRSNRRTRKIPIISFGSLDTETLVRAVENAGVSRYYPRPLKFGQLLADIQYFLKDRAPAAAPGDKPEKRSEDFGILLNKDKKPLEKLEIMVNYVGKLMAFPFTVGRILNITQDQKTGAEDLSKAIKSDSAVTATLLKVANSVLFASRDRTISDIRDAVVRLGFNETKNIALCMSVMKTTDSAPKSAGFDRMGFWYHSLAAGVIAEQLAKRAGFPNPEEAFVAGLLHDFGILMLDEFFGEIFEKVMEKATGGTGPFGAAVNETLGLHPNALVDRLFAKWNIPPRITGSILQAPGYPTLESGGRGEEILLARAVGVANVIAKAACLGRECDEWVAPVPDEALKGLKASAGLTAGFFEDVRKNVELYAKFLKLEPHKAEEGPSLRLGLVNHSPSLFEPHLHYLLSQGYALTPLKSASEMETAGATPDVIVVNRGALKSPDEVRPFLKILKKKPGFKQDPERPAFVPVLVFNDNPEEEKTPVSEFAALKVLPKTLDLRQIEMTVDGLAGPAPAFQ